MERRNRDTDQQKKAMEKAFKELKQRLILLGYGATFVVDLIYLLGLVSVYQQKQPIDLVSIATLSSANYIAYRLAPSMKKYFS